MLGPQIGGSSCLPDASAPTDTPTLSLALPDPRCSTPSRPQLKPTPSCCCSAKTTQSSRALVLLHPQPVCQETLLALLSKQIQSLTIFRSASIAASRFQSPTWITDRICLLHALLTSTVNLLDSQTVLQITESGHMIPLLTATRVSFSL